MWAEMRKSSIRPSLQCEEAEGQKAVFGVLGGNCPGRRGEEGNSAGLGLHAADSFFNRSTNITTRATNHGHEKLLAAVVIQSPRQALLCGTRHPHHLRRRWLNQGLIIIILSKFNALCAKLKGICDAANCETANDGGWHVLTEPTPHYQVKQTNSAVLFCFWPV